MFYELRQYDIYPEVWDEYLVWAETKAFPVLLDELQFPLVGFWQNVAKADGPEPTSNILWILAWESEEEMRAKWAAWRSAPRYKEIWEGVGDPVTGQTKYHRQIRSTLLRSLPITANYRTLLPQ
jgi:hypothetical protein